jgi:hypothetical protein
MSHWRLEIVVKEKDRGAIAEAIGSLYISAGLRWKRVRSLSPNFGVSDKKAQYRENESARRLAKMAGVSHGYISLGHRVRANAPELEEQLRDGTITLQQAARLLKSQGRFKTLRELKRTGTQEPTAQNGA